MKIIRIGDKVRIVHSKNITGLVAGLKYNYGKRIYAVTVAGNLYDYDEDEIIKI